MRRRYAIIESMKTTEKPNNNLITGTILTLTAGIAWGAQWSKRSVLDGAWLRGTSADEFTTACRRGITSCDELTNRPQEACLSPSG